jgi:F5/8 type C domain
MVSKDIPSFYRRNFSKILLLFCWTVLIFSSQINGNFLNKANADSCTTNLSINGVTASGNDGNVPSNVLDNNLNTRWSNLGIGSWIRADLGSIQNICSVDIAWYLGNQRTSNFVIATSTDGTTFTNVFSGTSSGTTLNSEKYTIPSTNARYVRVTVNGNSQNNWASITELDIFGSSSSSGSCTNLPISGVTASGSETGNPPSNVLDNNLGTRWSSFGVGQWIRADLGSIQNICSVDIAWYNGNSRVYHFVIATSTDGTTFTNKFSGDSSGTTLNSEKYIIPATDARYVRVTVNGNSANNWASITELDIFGTSSAPPPSSCTTNLPISGVTASGNEVGNVPSNVLDGSLSTRWSSFGIGQWIRADLGSIQNICSVDIAWYNGNSRVYHFVIATSTDGTTFTNKFSGDSSGTTLNSEKYLIPATDARYVRVTVNGNSANNWASITELDIFGGGTVSDIDQFGIKKLYPTKNNGEQWFMNMNNPLGDSRFNPQNTITQNPDGSWKMKATKVRMAVYTSTGFDPDDIPTLDHSAIASKGYMLAPNDWRNFEMTQYVKVNTSPSDDNFSPNGRGGRHTGDGPPEGCEGSSMKGDVFFSGKVRFAKEQWHVSYVFTNLKTPTGSIEDKWVGIKFIVYNFLENNKVVVKTELWLDTNNNGNFIKVDENVDRGGWGTEGTECGGAPDQIISWGGPITTFRWDTATDVDFKFLSVREIAPPQ